MRTSMTTLTQIWMTLLLSNILPNDHNSDLPPSAKVSTGVCHSGIDECSRGSVDCWCHLLVCKNGAYEAPFGPKKVQQGIRISSTDHGPLPVLWSTSRPQQGHPAAYHQSLQWEVLHSQASVKWGSTTAWGWSAAGCRCSTTTSRFYLWSPTEIGVVYTTWGWPAGSQP